MNTPRDRGADELVLRSLHTAQQRVASAGLALNARNPINARSHINAAMIELDIVERCLTWPGGLE